MSILNPPLRVGQTLQARPGRKIGDCKVTGYVVTAAGMVWAVRNKIGDDVAMPLSTVYQLFEFEGQIEDQPI